MMIRMLFIFALLLGSVYLGVHLQHDPGYVLITVNHWIIETTLWVAILSLLLIFIIGHTLLITWHKIIHIPATWKHWCAERRAQKAQEKTRKGLIEFSEGHWSLAKKHLIKALPDADTPLLNYLTAARAAQEMGDLKLRDDYLRDAQLSMPEAKIAVELTQAQLQLANQQWEQALATLKHLQDLAPNHPYVLKLLLHLYEEIKDWQQIIVLLPKLKREHVLSNHEFKRVQQQSYLEAICTLIKQNQEADLTILIKTLPKELANNSEIIAAYCQHLITNKQMDQAETLLRQCLQKDPSNEKLIELYGHIKSDERQLKFAESLLQKTPHSAVLNLNLGRISVSNQLWGKAQSYFEESIKQHPTPIAYAELGKLYERLNDEKSACNAYRKGLMCLE